MLKLQWTVDDNLELDYMVKVCFLINYNYKFNNL